MSKLLVAHECHICGLVDEAEFIFSGPHIKQICQGCKRYVKFFHKSAIPDVREIKLKIWSITQKTIVIDIHKDLIGFVDNLSGIDNKIMYWRLYLSIKEGVNE